MSESSVATNWNAEWRSGRRDGEPPIPFVHTIVSTVGEMGIQGYGLYVGCGDGRNFLPLHEAGLRLHGMDIADEAIDQLRAKNPELLGKTFVGDFGNYSGAGIFDYILSLQVFQHGNNATAHNFFRKSREALRPNGLLFLRVNSASTEPPYAHKQIGRNKYDGITILYEDGPKKGDKIHFYTESELAALADENGFEILAEPLEVEIPRRPPLEGHGVQWETIWQKR